MDLSKIAEALINGKDKEVSELMQKALDEGHKPKEILDKGMIAGMDVVGQKFKSYEIFLPEVLVSARAMKAGMTILRPLLVESGEKLFGNFVIGTVKGDLHDIGKNIVASMLEGAGFQIIDLGVDVSPEKYYNAVIENKADFVGLSALLTTTMVNMKNVIDILVKNNIRNTVKVVIGGAPVTDEYAKKIGADGYAKDAPSAVELCKKWITA
jgi:5-methyltetrahydrofolate--homocysteine methyltransferase